MERMRSVPWTCRGCFIRRATDCRLPPRVLAVGVETWAVIRVALGQRAENNIPIQHKKKMKKAIGRDQTRKKKEV